MWRKEQAVPRKKQGHGGSSRRDDKRKPEDRITNALRRLARALDISSRKLSAETGVTSAQLSCLKTLDIEGVDTATEIARRVHLSPSTVVGVLDRLEDRKYITRERDGRDRRVVRVSLTKEGKELVRKTPHPVTRLLALRRDALSAADTVKIADSLEMLVAVLGADELDPTDPYGELSEEELKTN